MFLLNSIKILKGTYQAVKKFSAMKELWSRAWFVLIVLTEIGFSDGLRDPGHEDLRGGRRLWGLHLLGLRDLDVTPAIHNHVACEQDLVLHLQLLEADEGVTWNGKKMTVRVLLHDKPLMKRLIGAFLDL